MCSSDVRSGDHTSRLARKVLGGGLRQSQAKQFALAGAVFDQENREVRHHCRADISRECVGLEDEELGN